MTLINQQVEGTSCTYRITKAGLAALKGVNPIDPRTELLLEILARVPSMDEDNALAIWDDLVENFGSPESAISAFHSGEVGLQAAS